MNQEFIPYEQALALKELGFDESCISIYDKKQFKFLGAVQRKNSTYNDIVTAPLYQQAFRWFREKYNINTVISWRDDLLNYDVSLTEMKKRGYFFYKENYNIYEEAELVCLIKLINIIKSQSI